jgi:hypothetical protein
MSATAILNTLKKVPAPIFGTAAIAMGFTSRKAAALPRYAQWGLPALVGGLWFVWPAVDEEWKQSVGISPAAAPPAADEDAAAAGAEAPVPSALASLSDEAQAKVESAHLPEPEKALTEEEKAVMKAISEGDFSELEKEWDNFAVKTMNPNDDDDDDDDDDDEEDEDEEGEEEEEDDE